MGWFEEPESCCFCFVLFESKSSFRCLLGRNRYALSCWGLSLALSIIVGLVFSKNVLMYSDLRSLSFWSIWLSAWPCNNAFFQSSSWASSYFVFVLQWPYPHHDTQCHPLCSVRPWSLTCYVLTSSQLAVYLCALLFYRPFNSIPRHDSIFLLPPLILPFICTLALHAIFLELPMLKTLGLWIPLSLLHLHYPDSSYVLWAYL